MVFFSSFLSVYLLLRRSKNCNGGIGWAGVSEGKIQRLFSWELNVYDDTAATVFAPNVIQEIDKFKLAFNQ